MSRTARTSGRSALTGSSLRGAKGQGTARRTNTPTLRAVLLGFAVAAMALAIHGGLQRLGLPINAFANLAEMHGPLMICGVFGTLISLERAVAIGLTWPYAAPVCFALSAATAVAGLMAPMAVLAVAGATVFVAASGWIALRQRAMFTALLAVGTAMLLAGTGFWVAGATVSEVAGWWVGFLVLTIAAERLELSRVMAPSRLGRWLFVLAAGLVVAGAALGFDDAPGRMTLGLGLVGLAAWLARHDVAMRTVRMAGQARFMAAAMLAGYGWLAFTGLALLVGLPGPFAYDLSLHAVLIGFVLSMVFGHALIIFPAITGVRLRYWPPLYVPLAMLHLSVLVRVGGDLLEMESARMASGLLTVLSLATFGALVIIGRR